MKTWILLLPLLAACSSVYRGPASVRILKSPFTEIITKNAATAGLCPHSLTGDVCLVTYEQARSLCRSQAAQVPTARQYAEFLKNFGIRVLEKKDVKDKPPKGFYLVESLNEDGSQDAFYMNHSGYERPAGRIGNHRLWTSSTPPKFPKHAHVYYDEWGGGGGNSQDHLKTARNAFQCTSR